MAGLSLRALVGGTQHRMAGGPRRQRFIKKGRGPGHSNQVSARPFSLLSHFVIDLGLGILVSRTQNVSPFPICMHSLDLVQKLRNIDSNIGIRR
jgi:hypothetical protein